MSQTMAFSILVNFHYLLTKLEQIANTEFCHDNSSPDVRGKVVLSNYCSTTTKYLYYRGYLTQ